MEESNTKDTLEEYMRRTEEWLEEEQQGPGFSTQEMEEQWRRNHELSLQRKAMKEKKQESQDKKEP